MKDKIDTFWKQCFSRCAAVSDRFCFFCDGSLIFTIPCPKKHFHYILLHALISPKRSVCDFMVNDYSFLGALQLLCKGGDNDFWKFFTNSV